MKQYYSDIGLCLHTGITEILRLSIDSASSCLSSTKKVEVVSNLMETVIDELKGNN